MKYNERTMGCWHLCPQLLEPHLVKRPLDSPARRSGCEVDFEVRGKITQTARAPKHQKNDVVVGSHKALGILNAVEETLIRNGGLELE